MKFFKKLLISLMLITGIFWAIFEFVDYQLKTQIDPNTYAECHKIWSARGLYSSKSQQNSVESISAAFAAGAKGAEVDMFYDVERQRYVVSHDRPYKLKNGEILIFEDMLNNLETIGYIWIDFKKLRKLNKANLKNAVVRLQLLADKFGIKDRLYIEGSDPINLYQFSKAGFKTIFDIHPLPARHSLSKFMVNLYKTAFWIGGFSVISIQHTDDGILKYGETMHRWFSHIPLFLYHVPDNEKEINRLLALPNVRVFLVGRGQSINRFERNQCVRV
jgi:hypothetical protein